MLYIISSHVHIGQISDLAIKQNLTHLMLSLSDRFEVTVICHDGIVTRFLTARSKRLAKSISNGLVVYMALTKYHCFT